MAENEVKTQAAQLSAFATRVGLECKNLHAADSALDTRVTENANKLQQIEQNLGAVIDDTQASTTKTYSSSKIDSQITTAVNQVKTDLIGGASEAYDTLKEIADFAEQNKSLIDSLTEISGKHVRFDQGQTLTDEQKAQARTNIAAASQAAVEAAQAKADANGTAIGTLASLTTDAKADVVTALNEIDAHADAAQAQADKGVADAATAAAAAATADGKAVAAKNAADAAQADVDALEAAIGDTTVDYVALFEAALV